MIDFDLPSAVSRVRLNISESSEKMNRLAIFSSSPFTQFIASWQRERDEQAGPTID